MNPSRCCSVFLIALVLVLISREPRLGHAQEASRSEPASAASAATLERAKQAFHAGAAAYAAGDYLAAVEALEAAYALTPLPAIAFSLAQAERRQYFVSREPEHIRRAITLFRTYLEQEPQGGRRKDAVEALAQLEPIAAKLDVQAAEPALSSTRHTRLIIVADVPEARISVDGAAGAGSPLLVEVEPGEHRVEVAAPGFATETRAVAAVSGELIPVSIALTPLPSRIDLSTPAAAEIYVDGIYASQGGERVQLELPPGTHRVSVAQSGHSVATRVLELRPGERQSHVMELEATAQRRAAQALFIGGAGATVAGAVLSVFALGAQDSARDFLAKRERENVSAGERVRYEDDVTKRDRYRWLAGASFGAGLGMLITGLFLHELDDPEPEDLHAPPSPRLDVSITPAQVNATLGVEF